MRSSRGGGVHPRFGTRNSILPLTEGTYLEVVEVLDHPASDKAPFGQAVRARSELGGGWLGWAVAVDDIAPHEAAPGPRVGQRQPAPSRRRRAALEAARRQGPPVRPAAALLHRVGHRARPAPQCRCDRQRLARGAWRSPATPPASRSGSARPSSSRSRTSRSTGSPPTAPPASSPRSFQTPHGARPRLRMPPEDLPDGAIPSPNIWHSPPGLRDREPRGRPRRGRSST